MPAINCFIASFEIRSKDKIIMEPGIAEFGKLAYGVDIFIRDTERGAIICGEVKKNRSEFEALVEGFRYCCQGGAHGKAQCSFSKNHPKFEFCSVVKPRYFFATAPGEEICFKLVYENGPYIEGEQRPCRRSHCHEVSEP
jgi:hypothetical protein